ncbi:MAG: caspase family protein [Planctomycetota bacterium]
MLRAFGRMAWLLLFVLAGCTVSIGPDLIVLKPSQDPPLLRLEGVSEKLTGGWEAVAPSGIRPAFQNLMRGPEMSSLFSGDSDNLGLRISIVTEHADDGPRLFGLGCASVFTLGIIPMTYHSVWHSTVEADVRMSGGRVVKSYVVEQDGTFDIVAWPLTMFNLMFAGFKGPTYGREVMEKISNNTASQLMDRISADRRQLSILKKKNAEELADLSSPRPPPVAGIGPIVEPPKPIDLGPGTPPLRPVEPAPLRPAEPASVARPTPPPTPSPAAKPVMAGRGFAVVVGISKYKNAGKAGLTDLLYADADAQAFAGRLKALGWPEDRVKVLLNEKATRNDVLVALESWLTKAGPEDTILLFWSGHGYPDPDDPEKVYFACHDSDLSIPATGYRMDHVRRAIEERNARNVIVLADTCHAGKLITRGTERAIAVEPYVQALKREGKTPKGWVFMVGADTDRTAVEHSSWSNGAFTHCLLQALSGKADGYESAGAKDGVVTMGELRAWMTSAMPDETQKVLGTAKRPIVATSSGDTGIWNLTLQGK